MYLLDRLREPLHGTRSQRHRPQRHWPKGDGSNAVAYPTRGKFSHVIVCVSKLVFFSCRCRRLISFHFRFSIFAWDCRWQVESCTTSDAVCSITGRCKTLLSWYSSTRVRTRVVLWLADYNITLLQKFNNCARTTCTINTNNN